MIIHRKCAPNVKKAALMLAPLMRIAIAGAGLLLMAGAIYFISTDPWFQQMPIKKGIDLEWIVNNPTECIRNSVEIMALVAGVGLVFMPAPTVRLTENADALYIDIEV